VSKSRLFHEQQRARNINGDADCSIDGNHTKTPFQISINEVIFQKKLRIKITHSMKI
jgi:hypothetical protein